MTTLADRGKKKAHNFFASLPLSADVWFRVPREVFGRNMKKSELRAVMKEEVSSLPEGIMPL